MSRRDRLDLYGYGLLLGLLAFLLLRWWWV